MTENDVLRNKPAVIAIVVAIVATAVAGWFFLSRPEKAPKPAEVVIPKEPEVVPPPELEPEPEPEPEPAPPPEPEPEAPKFVLPLLNDSDALIRDGVVNLTRHEGINAWLGSNELVRKFVSFADGVSRGQVAKEPVRALTPQTAFTATQVSDSAFVMDARSYERYNGVANIVASIDARRAAEFYDLVRPLFQQAYEELGYGDQRFDDVVFRAVGRLLETPVIEDEIRLVRPVVMYEYEDEKLESLSPIQKQMLRMGPRNIRLLQGKLREVSAELRGILGDG